MTACTNNGVNYEKKIVKGLLEILCTFVIIYDYIRSLICLMQNVHKFSWLTISHFQLSTNSADTALMMSPKEVAPKVSMNFRDHETSCHFTREKKPLKIISLSDKHREYFHLGIFS